MPMPTLKLTMASSLCANPYKLVRHITSTRSTPPSTTTTTTTTANSSSPTQFSCSRWRLTPCVHFKPVVHVSPHPSKNLPLFLTMFRGRKTCFSSSPTYPSLDKARFSGSNHNPDSLSSGSGIVDDMDPDNEKNINGDWYGDQPPSMQHQQQQPPSSKLLTLPTILTLGRVAAVPLLISTFYVDSWWGRTATTSIFIAAAITDWLDGYIARKMSLGSTFGAFLDPVADKLMVAAALVLLCTRPLEISVFGEVPWLLPVPAIAIIGREITMSAVREWAASQNAKLLEAVAVNNLGKWKTATQMIALTILLATRDSSLGGPWYLVGSGVVLLYTSAGLSLWSLAVYMGKISKVLLK